MIYKHQENEILKIYEIVENLKSLKKNLNIETILYDPITDDIVSKSDQEINQNENFYINHSVLSCINNFCYTLSDDYILNKKINENLEFKFLGKKNLIRKKEFELEDVSAFDNDIQYYCQGLYLFTFREPCFMCSMALVHSRIERVYFFDENNFDGGLISRINLNNYNLNHKFFIFKIENVCNN